MNGPREYPEGSESHRHADYYHRKRLIIEFVAGIGLLANALTLNGTSIPQADAEILGPVNAEVIVAEGPRKKSVEELVREYFKDTPELISVAWCESRFKHEDKDGSIHRGRQNSDDIGVMQINIVYHLEKALELDMDLYDIEGNMAYAKYLYEKQGLAPWSASQPCWDKYINRNVAEVAFAENH